ncbi:hypothetical protein OH76DRAFT_1491029 [Lentinus brumalis]|uniref:Uncharacterized protein n=1 Tax=Lentinus brumalis TaxID=2498619 RepID=A0A371CGY6_9APHY|nr:hypothetical protein OH76DRAFT_1491029 [Polyporus brumalis]
MARRGEERALRADSRRDQGTCVLDEATNAVGAARERNWEDDKEQAQVVVDESEQGVLSAVCSTLRHLVTGTRVYRGQPQPVFMVSHRICLYVPRYIHVQMFKRSLPAVPSMTDRDTPLSRPRPSTIVERSCVPLLDVDLHHAATTPAGPACKARERRS